MRNNSGGNFNLRRVKKYFDDEYYFDAIIDGDSGNVVGEHNSYKKGNLISVCFIYKRKIIGKHIFVESLDNIKYFSFLELGK